MAASQNSTCLPSRSQPRVFTRQRGSATARSSTLLRLQLRLEREQRDRQRLELVHRLQEGQLRDENAELRVQNQAQRAQIRELEAENQAQGVWIRELAVGDHTGRRSRSLGTVCQEIVARVERDSVEEAARPVRAPGVYPDQLIGKRRIRRSE